MQVKMEKVLSVEEKTNSPQEQLILERYGNTKQSENENGKVRTINELYRIRHNKRFR